MIYTCGGFVPTRYQAYLNIQSPCTTATTNHTAVIGTHGCLQPQYRSSKAPPSCRDALDLRVRNQPCWFGRIALVSHSSPPVVPSFLANSSVNFERCYRSFKSEKAQRITSDAPLLQRSIAEQQKWCFSLDYRLESTFFRFL